jgi:hypothetical protein
LPAVQNPKVELLLFQSQLHLVLGMEMWKAALAGCQELGMQSKKLAQDRRMNRRAGWASLFVLAS